MTRKGGDYRRTTTAGVSAGFVRRHSGRTANLLHQFFISWLGFARHPCQGLRQTATTYFEPGSGVQQRYRLAIRKPQLFVRSRGQSHRSRCQLRGRTAHRVRDLAWMPVPYSSSTTLAPVPQKYETRSFHLGLRYLSLILLLDLNLFQFPAAVRETAGQFGLQCLVNQRGI